MAEYIEREKAKQRLVHDYAYAAANILDEIPAADVVEVVHGEWIEKHWYKRGDCYHTKNCSLCNCAVKPKHTYNFCPNCGAKMDAEKKCEDA